VVSVARAAGIERARLIAWLLAYSGLSAAWSLADGPGDAAATLRITEAAAALA
jgi:streptomycin 6-kinase